MPGMGGVRSLLAWMWALPGRRAAAFSGRRPKGAERSGESGPDLRPRRGTCPAWGGVPSLPVAGVCPVDTTRPRGEDPVPVALSYPGAPRMSAPYDKKSLSERDICTKFISPAIVKAGWDVNLQMREQVYLTKGRVIVRGKLVTRARRNSRTTSCTGSRTR